jgi:putative redox protein
MNEIVGITEATNTGDLYTTLMQSNGFECVADEPAALGGKNLGPTPGDYLCMALASCKAITLRMYIQRKQWQVDAINVKVNMVKGDQNPTGVNTFHSEIAITGNLDEAQQQRIIHIAKACPISKLLQKQNEVVTTVVQTQP